MAFLVNSLHVKRYRAKNETIIHKEKDTSKMYCF